MPDNLHPVSLNETNSTDGVAMPALAGGKNAKRTLEGRVAAAQSHFDAADNALGSLTKIKVAKAPLSEIQVDLDKQKALIELRNAQAQHQIFALLLKVATWIGLAAFMKFDRDALRGAFLYIIERAAEEGGLDFFKAKAKEEVEARRIARMPPLIFGIDTTKLGAEGRDALKRLGFRRASRIYPDQLEGAATIRDMQDFATTYNWSIMVATEDGVLAFAENGSVDIALVGRLSAPGEIDQGDEEGQNTAEIDQLVLTELGAEETLESSTEEAHTKIRPVSPPRRIGSGSEQPKS